MRSGDLDGSGKPSADASRLEYRVTQSHNLDLLMRQVNEAIDRNWEPIGGICHANPPYGSTQDYFSQAMIRRRSPVKRAARNRKKSPKINPKGPSHDP